MLTKTIGSSPLPETDPIAQTPTSTIPYIYGDANWKDKLTSFNGNAITYDNVGNPLTYAGYTYTWEDGRQLAGISGNSKTISYSYNDQGIRQSKTVNDTTTTYRLVGDRVSWEGNGTDSIYYTYDGSGNLVSMNLNGTEYFYTRNLQGDITGLIDNGGTQVVSYSYDSWGKVLSTTGSLADTLGQKNPYRYRGYRLDSETGMYYLNSRYYVPEWGRFFTPDVVMNTTGDLNGYNLYAYAANSPAGNADSSGFFVETAIDVASAGYSAYEMAKNPSWLNLGMLVWDVAAICIPILPGSYALKATKAIANVPDGGSHVKQLTNTMKLADHHIIPKFRGNSKQYAEFISKRDIDVDDYTVTLVHGEASQHLKYIHGQGKWNKKWMDWIDNNPGATTKDVYQFAGKMMDEYGLSGLKIHPYGR